MRTRLEAKWAVFFLALRSRLDVRAADLSVAGLARDAVKLVAGCWPRGMRPLRAKLVFQLTPEGEISPARFIQL